MPLRINIDNLVNFCASGKRHYVLRARNFVEARDMAANRFLFGEAV